MLRIAFSLSVKPCSYSYYFRDNMKVRLPELVRQFCAEVLGTFLLVLFGDGAIAQVVLGRPNNLERAYCRK